jgi:regulator of protease activity HflC (stomatin/prohibitin superfamily)
MNMPFNIPGLEEAAGRMAEPDWSKKPDGNALLWWVKAFVGFFLAVIILSCSIVVVPAGNVGVRDTFGVVDNEVFPPGLHLKNPFTNVVMFSGKTQKYYDPGTGGANDVATITAISNDALTITMGIAMNYHIDPGQAPELYKTVGENYPDIIIKPPVHSVPRDVISKYDVKTLYSASRSADNPDRAKIEQELNDGIASGVLNTDGSSRGIVIERVFLRSIDLPKSLKDSIEAKLQQEQAIQTKAFEVQVAEQEANRKIVEARGIAEANHIISGSLTDQYLRWYWVENQKTNPNVVYVVPSDNPFPFVKDIDNTPQAAGGWGRNSTGGT